MGQARINKAKYLHPSRRKEFTTKKCVVCGKTIGYNRCRDCVYELCHRHYLLLTNARNQQINLKQAVILMKQIREDYSQNHGSGNLGGKDGKY